MILITATVDPKTKTGGTCPYASSVGFMGRSPPSMATSKTNLTWHLQVGLVVHKRRHVLSAKALGSHLRLFE